MKVINWLDFKPTELDIKALVCQPGQTMQVRLLVRRMVQNCLRSYPWQGREDLIPLFNAASAYQTGQVVAWPVIDKQEIRPDSWQTGIVKSVEVGENAEQGKFQVVQLDVDGKSHWLAAAVEDGEPLAFRFPPDEDELDFLAGELVNLYLSQLTKIIDDLIDRKKLDAIRQGDQVVFGKMETIQADFAPWFAELPSLQPFLTIDDIILRLWEVGELTETPKELACVIVEKTLLERGYMDAGGGRWMTPEKLTEFDRQVSRRLEVPRNRSKIKAQFGDMEELDANDFIELPERARSFLDELEVEGDPKETAVIDQPWTPPTSPLKMPILSYLNIMQGYFPLTGTLLRAFPPRENAGLVDVQLVEGDDVRFVVNLQERALKSIDPQAVYRRFVSELAIPAGTLLWLEYRGESRYRIVPHPLGTPRPVRCKQAWLEEDGSLHVEEGESTMHFEGDEHLFQAELRFEDIDALFKEAEECDFSIFDAIYDVFPKLAALRPDGLAHYSDIFNAVFFEYRMCSYRTVVHELYDHACFAEAGNGYFRFAPELGVQRRQPTRRQIAQAFWKEQPVTQHGKIPILEVGAEFWRQIADEIPRKLHTLDEHKPFEISSVTHETIELIVSTGQPRTLQREDIEQAWQELSQNGQIDHDQVTRFANFNVAYVMAILAQLPGVNYKLRPLRLMFKPLITEQIENAEILEEVENVRTEKTRSGQLIAPDLLPSEPLFSQKPNKTDDVAPSEKSEPVLLNFEGDTTAGDLPDLDAPAPAEAGQGKPEVVEHFPEAGTSGGQVTIEAPTKVPSLPRRQRASAPKGDEMQNKTLFSNNFMGTRLGSLPEWKEDPLPVMAQMRAFWQKAARFGETWNEAQTEEEFIKPVLKLLGWSYVVQAKARRGGQTTRPDYALFPDEAAKDEAQPFQGNDDAFYGRALAIAEAKHWGRPLSAKDSSGRATWKAESNPSHQMVSYLVGTRTEWGILTNGHIWRLYSREVSSTASEFYEVDLGNLFDFLPEGTQPSQAQVDDFKRWWLFFRREAFTSQGQVREAGAKSFVQRVHEGSALYAREISDKLKELVFEDVMPEIAGGFVAYRFHQIGIREETPESLYEIYRASLSLLYKMLFLLYAEARSLLPMENPDYRANSLTEIAEWAAEQFDAKRSLSDATYATPRYDSLLALFRRIDRGDPALGIPEYNGGLFSPKNAANIFLDGHKLSDHAVARAVDTLVRDAGQPVDYAFISVRNLGAIYEGLLENKLRVVDAAAGKVELVNDKGERKASGSYYTPDYIVEYIVQNTLDPILEQRNADYARGMERVTELRGKLLKVSDSATAARLRAQLEEAEREAREAFLGIKVLDPAMGSGHFLVNAVDHLTDGIIQRMQTWHDAHPESPWEWDPIQQLIERVRTEIRNELENNHLPVDNRLNDDTALLMRLVMKRCVYGVDLNEMAVELARVSLWLHTFTVGAPLSFLDHHLRWGNSLIGADVRTVEYNITTTKKETRISEQAKRRAEARGETTREAVVAFQSNLFGGPFAGLLDLTGMMIEVAERADATLADVRASAQEYETLQKELIPYKQALNLWVSQYFDNPRALEFFASYKDRLLDVIRNPQSVEAVYAKTIGTAQELWEEKRFFHWDLEFPEVFVDLRKRDWAVDGGFDAVIGNPPYSSKLSTETKTLTNFFDFVEYKCDPFAFFVELGAKVISNRGQTGLIIPAAWMTNFYYEKLRRNLVKRQYLKQVIFFKGLVFEDANIDTSIMLLEKGMGKDFFVSSVSDVGKVSPISKTRKFEDTKKLSRCEVLPPSDGWDEIREKIDPLSQKLSSISKISLGMKLRSNDEFVSKVKDKMHFEPIYFGDDIQRYEPLTPTRFFSYKNSVVIGGTKNPKVYNAKTKILIQAIRNLSLDRRLVSTIDFDGSYFVGTVNGIVLTENKYSPLFVQTCLASNLLNGYFSNFFVTISLTSAFLGELPIPKIDFISSAETRSLELDRVKRMYAERKLAEVLNYATGFLPRQADVVHDLLAYLAEQMIDLNKACQEEMKGFLAHLSREVGVDLDDLTGKTTLFNYLGDYQKGEEAASFDDLLAVLRKNQKKLSVDVSGRAFQEALAREYEASLEKLLPIKKRLADTDHLIDQIVYALYGLSEAEIKVVEGRAE